MARTITEKKVLKKLDIPDFRHMTKDKVVSFVSMLPRMDPEVAKKALEQFPDFSNAAVAITELLKDAVERVTASNESNMEAFNNACMATLDRLGAELEKGDLSEDTRTRIIDAMMEVVVLMGEKDSENKEFLSGLTRALSFAMAIAIVCLAAALGIKAGVDWDDK